MIRKTVAFSLLFLLGVMIAGMVSAQVEPTPTQFGSPITGITSGSELIGVIDAITNWIFVALIVTATIFIILAGWQFVTSGGDPQAVVQARNKLLYAAVGILIALLSRGVTTAISNLVS